MCRIAAERGHVELFVVHEDGPAEGFPEIGYIDVGGDPPERNGDGGGEDGQNEEGGDEAAEPQGQMRKDGIDDEAPSNGKNEEGGDTEAPPNGQNQDGVYVEDPPNGQNEVPVVEDTAPIDEGDVADGDAALEEQGHENEGDIAGGPETEDSDNDDAEYVPSADDVDSADDVHFTDNEEEFEFDDDFFGLQTDAGEKSGDGKGKRVVNEEFSNAGEDSDELEDGHTVGGYEREEGGDEGSEGGTIVFPVHKSQQNMAEYRW
ncbi:hypothetical protein PIB30_061616 [Stylosanthes scabra]|uniref:Midasin n=1 Tax=Stylosanthes scabra TaxID=79078 RepID=A0ABU6ZJK2_9FABA|nr:hypothetical protein [Stylosanthes scabra]